MENFRSDAELEKEYERIFEFEKKNMKEKCKLSDKEADNVIKFQRNLRFGEKVDNQTVDIAKEPAFTSLNKKIDKGCILSVMNKGETMIDDAQKKREEAKASGMNMTTIVLVLLVAYLLYKKFSKRY